MHTNRQKFNRDLLIKIDLDEYIQKSILSKAFRGKLGSNDPDDEPAIELLKRSLKEKMNE